MKLTKNTTYTSDNCDLQMQVVSIYYESSKYYKIFGILTNKKNGIFYEMQNYTLYKNQITHWKKDIIDRISENLLAMEPKVLIPHTDECLHEWKSYHGILESYVFCEKCDKKKE